MTCASLALAILAFGAGLWAARLWLIASRVQIVPFWADGNSIEPVLVDEGHTQWIVAVLQSAQKSGKLNGHAAIWTAVSVFLSTASTVVGALSTFQHP